MTWMLAHNILYTYVAPFVTPAGLASDIDVVLLVFGIAALLSIWITGRLVDRYLRNAVLLSLATFAATAFVFGFFSQSVVVIYVGTFVWGLTFGGAATLLQTALADTAGEGADVALSMNVVAWNGAIAIAGLFGGVLLDQVGVVSFPWVLLVLLLAGLWIAVAARAHGFPQGKGKEAQQWSVIDGRGVYGAWFKSSADSPAGSVLRRTPCAPNSDQPDPGDRVAAA